MKIYKNNKISIVKAFSTKIGSQGSRNSKETKSSYYKDTNQDKFIQEVNVNKKIYFFHS